MAARFSEAMIPSKPLLTDSANRQSDRWTGTRRALGYEWMREFYRIRGDFAHGKLNSEQPTVWNEPEHLVLATIAFPLIVKCLLSNVGLYELRDNDVAQIDAFEELADTTKFLEPPPDQRNSFDSHWSRLRSDRKSQLAVRRAVDMYRRALKTGGNESPQPNDFG